MQEIKLPELGEGIQKAVVACWHFKQGQSVKKDDDVLEVVTDKAVFNVPAPQNGKLKQILIADGQEAKIGEVLGVIE
jgi:pyruvate/2-oxoglutarate dehydrogenase complex dihydrolipoamide acyltransferase (E2) component